MTVCRAECDRPAVSHGLCPTHWSRFVNDSPLGLAPIGISFRTGCDAPGCDRPHDAHGLCTAHYKRRRSGSALGMTAPIQSGPIPVCADPACDRRAHHTDPLCDSHRARVRMGLKITGAIREQGQLCGEPDCDRPHHARGLCRSHYARKLDGRTVAGPIVGDRRGQTMKTHCTRCGTRVIPNSDRYVLIEEETGIRRYFCRLVHLALWIADGDGAT